MPDRTLPTQTQVDELLAAIAALNDEIELHRRDLRRMNFRNRLLAVTAGLLTAALIAVAVVVVHNERTLRAVNRSREERTAINCVRDNVAIEGQREALIDSILTFAADPSHLTEAELAALDEYTEAVEIALPFRDCSAEGIDAYFDTIPDDPATATSVAG
jgi:hypothetical protein